MENINLGKVEISPRALAVIISIAVNEVEGISKLIGSIKNEAFEKMGKKEYFKGVKLNFEDNELNVEVSCCLKSGYSVNKVVSNVQENIRNSVYNMTELNTKTININILGIDY